MPTPTKPAPSDATSYIEVARRSPSSTRSHARPSVERHTAAPSSIVSALPPTTIASADAATPPGETPPSRPSCGANAGDSTAAHVSPSEDVQTASAEVVALQHARDHPSARPRGGGERVAAAQPAPRGLRELAPLPRAAIPRAPGQRDLLGTVARAVADADDLLAVGRRAERVAVVGVQRRVVDERPIERAGRAGGGRRGAGRRRLVRRARVRRGIRRLAALSAGAASGSASEASPPPESPQAASSTSRPTAGSQRRSLTV